jgi:CHAT domain-containing protein/tetratricopeptide (TPR) repeat protein
LARELDPSNPISILVHAKAIYMTGDHTRTRGILDVLSRHLHVDRPIERGRKFGYAITHYRQRDFANAVKYFNELERLAVEHNSPGDVALASIYRGEIYLLQHHYDEGYTMFQKAKTTYDQNHVAHFFGIVIISKSAVAIKAGVCQKSLGNLKRAEELYEDAIVVSVKARQEAVQLPSSHPWQKRVMMSTLRDEIAAHTYRGNHAHNIGESITALKHYKIALERQESVNVGDNGNILGQANSNVGVALLAVGEVQESLVYLRKSFDLAKRYERDGTKIAQAANNLGNALMSNKNYEEALYYYEIALGHSVNCKDSVGQAKYLGSIGNVMSIQGKDSEALRCYTEALTLTDDEDSRISVLQNRAVVYLSLAVKVTGGGEWDEIPGDVEEVQPVEVQSVELPIPVSRAPNPDESARLHLVAPEGSYTKIPLDDGEEILDSENSSVQMSSSNFSQPSRPPLSHQSAVQGDVQQLDTLSLSHKKCYLLKAMVDLQAALDLIEEKFRYLKERGSVSFSLPLFETNSRAFYYLQRVLVLLGKPQKALRVAEQSRARILSEVLWNKRKQFNPELRELARPDNLSRIFKIVTKECTPLIVLSYIKQSSTMLVHIIFPRADEGSEDVSGYTNVDEENEIPAGHYHFEKVILSQEYFLDKAYGIFNATEGRSVPSPIAFDRYVMKTLMEYLNQNEVALFTPIDFQDDETPLTILFERFARPIVEVIEQKCPKAREFVVVADQVAHFLPWTLLQDETTKKFLGDHYRVRTYPSIWTMGVSNYIDPEAILLPSEENFLVVGNPYIPKFLHNGFEIVLGRLPHSEVEAIQVASILETTPLIREMATKSTMVFRMQSAKIIHIATHSSPSHGYLAFACNVPQVNTVRPVEAREALIFIDEIRQMHIGASLVVLSACDSARGKLVNEGVDSVANAFLAAGALSVLVSLFRVPDKSASIFMSLFYRFLSHDGFNTSEAIQKSSMCIRCIKSLSQHIHWGSFQLIGRNIRVTYDESCQSAKVSKFLGGASAFQRHNLMQEVEMALFREDRSQPRDVMLVNGMAAHDPAEIVRDFISKRCELYRGGVFWYNCSTAEQLKTSVALVGETLTHLTSIEHHPPAQPKKATKRRENVSQRVNFVPHHKLVVLDHPFDLETCVDAIPALREEEVDIIVVSHLDCNRDKLLTKFFDSQLIRGCTELEVSHLDTYSSLQRMAYHLLRTHHFSPCEEDYEAFETITAMCYGCASLVKVFEGLLEEGVDSRLQTLGQEIDQCKDLVTEYKDADGPPLQQQTASSFSSVSAQLSKELGKRLPSFGRKPKEDRPKEGSERVQNGLVVSDKMKRLTEEVCVTLSEGLEKLPRLLSSWCNFLPRLLTSEEHCVLQCLSYLSGYPAFEQEGVFCFPEEFILQVASVVSAAEKKQLGREIVDRLRRLNLLLFYPRAVLYPTEWCHPSLQLFVPDIIVRSMTYNIDEADIAFSLAATKAALDQCNHNTCNISIRPVELRFLELTKHNEFSSILHT